MQARPVSRKSAWPSGRPGGPGTSRVFASWRWWREAPGRFQPVASEPVVTEAGAGDSEAARARVEALESASLLGISEEAEALTRKPLDEGAAPHRAAADAAHIAIAVTNGVDDPVTWNFRHIANAAMRTAIERICRQAGYEPPVICTPNELLGTDDANDAH